MKTSAALLCTLLLAAAASAQYYRAEQQARRDSALNNAEQQRIANAAGNGSAPAPPASAAPSAPPPDPLLQATLANISSLQADFAAFTAAAKPDGTQKVSLLNHLSQAAQSKKAGTDSAKQLATDLQAALAGKKNLTPAQSKQLAACVHAVFNGSHLADAQSEKIFTAAQKILTDAGVPADSVAGVVADLKKIAAETK